MKKLLSVLLVVCLVLTLPACGKEEEKELTPIEKCQRRAVSVGDAYLDFELTAKEAKEQLEAIDVPETEDLAHQLLATDIHYLIFLLSRQDPSYSKIEDKVESMRDKNYHVSLP